MSQDNNTANLDLAQILQTLANLPPLPEVAQQSQPHPYNPTQGYYSTTVLSHESNAPLPAPYQPNPSLDPASNNWSSLQHRQAPPKPQQCRSATPTIDPSTIVEWKLGLRCVNKVAAQNSNFAASVQKLIKDQEQNVKTWAAGRDRLNEEQIAKRENEQKTRAALTLPGVIEGTAPLRTPEREQQEHDQYSQKVYRASRQMVDSHSAALKGLGVPFFGMKPDLVLAENPETIDSDEESELKPATSVDGKITKKRLIELQCKMLNHLMELYGD